MHLRDAPSLSLVRLPSTILDDIMFLLIVIQRCQQPDLPPFSLTVLALVILCPIVVDADDEDKIELGAVIGIGE